MKGAAMQKLIEMLRLAAAVAVMLNAGFLLTGCETNGDDMEDAAEEVGEAVEEAGEDIEDAAD